MTKIKFTLLFTLLVIGMFSIGINGIHSNTREEIGIRFDRSNIEINTETTSNSEHWSDNVLISNGSEFTIPDFEMVVDSMKNIHIVWQDSTEFINSGSDTDIFYRYWNNELSVWSSTTLLSTNSNLSSFGPDIDFDSENNLHVVWQESDNFDGSGDDNDIMYREYDKASDTWESPVVISTESTEPSYDPEIEVDSEDNVLVVWEDDTIYDNSEIDRDIFFKQRESVFDSWLTTEVVSTNSTENSLNPTITADYSGNIHVAWQDHTEYQTAGIDDDIFYKKKSLENSWDINTTIISKQSDLQSSRPNIITDYLNNVYVIWNDEADYYNTSGIDYDVVYKKYEATQSEWTLTEVVSKESTRDSFSPVIQVDNLNNLHVVWSDFTDYRGSGNDLDIFYNKMDSSSSTWAGTEVVTKDIDVQSWQPKLSIDSSNYLHLLWEDLSQFHNSGEDRDLFYKNSYANTIPILNPIDPTSNDFGVVNLSWNSINGALSYNVYRSQYPMYSISDDNKIITTNSTHYVDNITQEGYYYYAITSNHIVGESDLSNNEYVNINFGIDDTETVTETVTENTTITESFENTDEGILTSPLIFGFLFMFISYPIFRTLRRK